MTDPVVQRTTVPLKLSRAALDRTRCPNVLCQHVAGEHHTRPGGATSYCSLCETQRRRGIRNREDVCSMSSHDINRTTIEGRYGS